MTFHEHLAKFSAAEIIRALGCPRATAYQWKDGNRNPPDWQQPHWLEILSRTAKPDTTKRAEPGVEHPKTMKPPEARAAVSGEAAVLMTTAKASEEPKEEPKEEPEEEPEPVVMDGTKEAPRMAPHEERARQTSPYQPDHAAEKWLVARLQLDAIHAKDVSRERILREVVDYCENRLKTKKKRCVQ